MDINFVDSNIPRIPSFGSLSSSHDDSQGIPALWHPKRIHTSQTRPQMWIHGSRIQRQLCSPLCLGTDRGSWPGRGRDQELKSGLGLVRVISFPARGSDLKIRFHLLTTLNHSPKQKVIIPLWSTVLLKEISRLGQVLQITLHGHVGFLRGEMYVSITLEIGEGPRPKLTVQKWEEEIPNFDTIESRAAGNSSEGFGFSVCRLGHATTKKILIKLGNKLSN